jgi:phosphate transport system substrate-binding protein
MTRIAALFLLIPINVFAASQSLNWVGCGISKKAYVTDLAQAFETEYGVKINIIGGGATRGIRDVASGVADLGGTCRYILPDDPREAGVGLEPIAWDALVVITHKNNPVDSLTLQQLHDIYDGKIANWKQVGGRDARIELFKRDGKFSGVGRTLRKLVYADYDHELAATKSFPSSGPLEEAVVKTPDSMGVTGVSSARLRDVKILALEGVTPTYEAIKSGSYRMYRPLYLVYNPDSPHIDLVKKFMRFCQHSKGRKIMKQNGTLPYIEGLPLVMKQIDQEVAVSRRQAGRQE